MILLLDNYDSFTYNLRDYFERLGLKCKVVRNDLISIREIRESGPSAIVISPGPGRPADAGILMECIDQFAGKIPLLGICLGHQAIGEYFGARLVKAPVPVHGKTSLVVHNGDPLFNSIPSPFEAMRYHSLLLEDVDPNQLDVIASTFTGEIMALRHKTLPLYGIQFHPESVLTSFGYDMLANWKSMIAVLT